MNYVVQGFGDLQRGYYFRMDDHNSHLEKICRICANRISKKNKKTVSTALEFKGLIHRTFQYDIDTDDENVHPKNLCIPCKDKLRSVVEPGITNLLFYQVKIVL